MADAHRKTDFSDPQAMRRAEISHLVLGFLRQDKDKFPNTIKWFEHEARETLSSIRPGRKGVKNLCSILEEYVALKEEKQQREKISSMYMNDPNTANHVSNVMENMARLLEDYKIMRSLQMGGLSHPSKPKSCEDLKERIETQTVQESNKRRKVSRTTVDVQPVQQTTTEDVAVSHEKPKQITETAKENTEQADSAAIPNLYSDISESFLSDPQISSLLQDANSIEDIFGESNLSWLVEPLTNHINAKLNESNSTDCSNTGKAQASNDTERRKQGERRSGRQS
mmetsp:Transcript_21088/g.70253  ORF Transcript_21088/g.70253 Transcript_21088/m.70253 type:complete len:283 (-) Transcript_21088:51-899(-)